MTMYHELEQNEFTEDSAWVVNCEWVGIVLPQDRPKSTLITPLAFYDKGWVPIPEYKYKTYFPNNGKVVYFPNSFFSLEFNCLYQFRPEPTHKNNDVGPSHSYYVASADSIRTQFSLAQLLNWTADAPDVLAIPSLLERGLSIERYLCRTIYVRYQDRIYGPIDLELDQNKPQLLKPQAYLGGSSNGDQKLLLNQYPFHKEIIVELNGKQFVDEQVLSSPTGLIDWSPPEIVIKRALAASKDLPELERQERLVDKEIRALAALQSAKESQTFQIEECTIERARYIIDDQRKHLHDLQTLKKLLDDLPAAHPLLILARSLEVERRKAEIEDEASQQSEQTLNHLQDLQKEVQVTEEKLASLKQEYEQAEKAKANLDDLESLIQKRLVPLREEPLRLLAELQLSTALPPTLFQPFIDTSTSKNQPIIKSSTRQQNNFFIDDTTIIIDSLDLHWAKVAKQCGIRAKSTKICTAALLAGLIPVIDKPAAFAMLQAVSQLIAGERIWSIPVSLTALSPLDLFGSIVPEHRLFVPNAGDLADILIEAQENPEQLGIVLLDGADRVPFLPVIAPLLRHYRALRQCVRQGERLLANQIPLSLFHTRALATDDSYQQLSRLKWPANLLLAITLDHDTSSFSLPTVYDHWFARIQTNEKEDHAEPKSNWPRKQECWQVSSKTWYSWEENALRQVSKTHDVSVPQDLELWKQVFWSSMSLMDVKDDLINIIEQLWPQEQRTI